MSSATFVDRIDPFSKRSLKKKSKKSQGSSRYRNSQDVELQQLPQLKVHLLSLVLLGGVPPPNISLKTLLKTILSLSSPSSFHRARVDRRDVILRRNVLAAIDAGMLIRSRGNYCSIQQRKPRRNEEHHDEELEEQY
ncbi:hypothetical protein KQX54_001247 [Cotesia glomerata]|uniref:Uncharacterized protein n=1 Tax=Cotesia glomerata TaxID=32391 RepID=A0AAV7IIH8_COTGL|nr:hypothetical protein KQX54_001247 [Cotesia glomerata]